MSPDSITERSASNLPRRDAMAATQTLRLASELAEIRRLADAVSRFAVRNGVSPKAAHHVNLAADELITNAIEHNPDRQNRRIIVRLRREPDRLVMEIGYPGPSFDPTVEARAPALDAVLDDRPIGGLGVHFAKTLLDGLSYVRRRDRNHLTLTKNL